MCLCLLQKDTMSSLCVPLRIPQCKRSIQEVIPFCFFDVPPNVNWSVFWHQIQAICPDQVAFSLRFEWSKVTKVTKVFAHPEIGDAVPHVGSPKFPNNHCCVACRAQQTSWRKNAERQVPLRNGWTKCWWFSIYLKNVIGHWGLPFQIVGQKVHSIPSYQPSVKILNGSVTMAGKSPKIQTRNMITSVRYCSGNCLQLVSQLGRPLAVSSSTKNKSKMELGLQLHFQCQGSNLETHLIKGHITTLIGPGSSGSWLVTSVLTCVDHKLSELYI